MLGILGMLGALGSLELDYHVTVLCTECSVGTAIESPLAICMISPPGIIKY